MAARIEPATEQAIVALYTHGHRGPEIASSVGCDTTTVYSALRRNGIRVTRPGYSEEERRRIAAIWRGTRSIEKVRQAFPAIGKNTVRSIADAAGDLERARGGSPKTSPQVEQEMCAKYLYGETAKAISKRHGVDKATVLNVLERCGIPRRRVSDVGPRREPLSTTHPLLAAQWHPTLNKDLGPGDVAAGTTRPVWWRCFQGPDHEWKAQVVWRTAGRNGCPFCAGKRASVTNSLAVAEHRAIARQWHPTRNGALRPCDVVATSTRAVWWRCPRGPDHEWEAKLVDRTSGGNGCPYCRGLRASVTNSILAKRPELAAEWHPTKNRGLEPHQVVAGSGKKVWWKCPNGPDHEWPAAPNNRISGGRGCPYCANLRLSVTNSLAVRFPRLAAELHPKRNGTLTARDLVAYSTKKVWWKCPKGPDHEWPARVNDRAAPQSGCPFCSGKRVCTTNSLAYLRPDLAAEWHPSKNRNLSPADVVAGSGRFIWWRCRRDPRHEWRTSPNIRLQQGTGCPECTIAPRSRDEIRLAHEIHALISFDLTAHKVRAGSRLWDVDILIASLKTIVEYDGGYWHRERASCDRRKSIALEAAGWRVIRVRQVPLRPLGPADIVLPKRADTKRCADLVLSAIEKRCRLRIPGLRRYLKRTTAVNSDAAQIFLDGLYTTTRVVHSAAHTKKRPVS